MNFCASAVPFYANWTFWAFVVAAAAVVLSQLPPLPLLLRRAALTVEPYDTMVIGETLGNPNLASHVLLSNTGGKTLQVLAMNVLVEKEDGDVKFDLPAQSLTKLDGSQGAPILTRFRLRPGGEWSHIVSFFRTFSWKEENEAKTLIKNLREDIMRKLDARKKASPLDSTLVEAKPELVKAVVAFAEKHAKWEPGDYRGTVTVTCVPATASVARSFRFTVFESDCVELAEQRDRCRYGFGVFLNDPDAVYVRPRLRDLT